MRLRTTLLVAAALAASGCDAGGTSDGAGQGDAPQAQVDSGGGGADVTADVPESDVAAPEEDTAVALDATPDTGPGGHPSPYDAGAPDVTVEPDIDEGPDLLHDPNVTCPPVGPYGEVEGDIAESFRFEDCKTGKPLDLHEICGAQGYWLFFTAGW
jgi:hypothetical protein